MLGLNTLAPPARAGVFNPNLGLNVFNPYSTVIASNLQTVMQMPQLSQISGLI
jgi:hypothetical protein